MAEVEQYYGIDLISVPTFSPEGINFSDSIASNIYFHRNSEGQIASSLMLFYSNGPISQSSPSGAIATLTSQGLLSTMPIINDGEVVTFVNLEQDGSFLPLERSNILNTSFSFYTGFDDGRRDGPGKVKCPKWGRSWFGSVISGIGRFFDGLFKGSNGGWTFAIVDKGQHDLPDGYIEWRDRIVPSSGGSILGNGGNGGVELPHNIFRTFDLTDIINCDEGGDGSSGDFEDILSVSPATYSGDLSELPAIVVFGGYGNQWANIVLEAYLHRQETGASINTSLRWAYSRQSSIRHFFGLSPKTDEAVIATGAIQTIFQTMIYDLETNGPNCAFYFTVERAFMFLHEQFGIEAAKDLKLVMGALTLFVETHGLNMTPTQLYELLPEDCYTSHEFDACVWENLLDPLNLTTLEEECLMYSSEVAARFMDLYYNSTLIDPCDINRSPEDIMKSVLGYYCWTASSPTISSLNESLRNEEIIGRLPSLASKCPQAACTLDKILNFEFGQTNFLCDALLPFSNGGMELSRTILFQAGTFGQGAYAQFHPDGLAATYLSNIGQIQIVLNDQKCEATRISPFELYEAIQHEVIHAEIYRVLLEEPYYLNLPLDQGNFDAVFFQFVLDMFPGKNYSTMHELMLGEYVQDMAQGIMDANGGLGDIEDYLGLVYNGFDLGELLGAGYDASQVYEAIERHRVFGADISNVASQFSTPCP